MELDGNRDPIMAPDTWERSGGALGTMSALEDRGIRVPSTQTTSGPWRVLTHGCSRSLLQSRTVGACFVYIGHPPERLGPGSPLQLRLAPASSTPPQACRLQGPHASWVGPEGSAVTPEGMTE
ncbi:uncharacterized protein LOC109258413 isoform X2 [Panthera pardus]|uniref:Uncharacterized protein LOC109258413 isoform X2 n=1 Tax=Panthera pardus TaxID=9691 RepID=A0A9W2V114_PANPR|nr:uncharacterized protein LOC109258413 isoform X2 [Panthera pardus]